MAPWTTGQKVVFIVDVTPGASDHWLGNWTEVGGTATVAYKAFLAAAHDSIRSSIVS